MASSEAQVKSDANVAMATAIKSEKALRAIYARLALQLQKGGANSELLIAYNQGVLVHRKAVTELIALINETVTAPLTVPTNGPVWLPRFEIRAAENGVAKAENVVVISGEPTIEPTYELKPGPAAASLGLPVIGYLVILGCVGLISWKSSALFPFAARYEAQKTAQAAIWANMEVLLNGQDRAAKMADTCAGLNPAKQAYLDCLAQVSTQLSAIMKATPKISGGAASDSSSFIKTVGVIAILGGVAYGGLRFFRWWKERDLNKKYASPNRQLPAYAGGYDYDVDADDDDEADEE